MVAKTRGGGGSKKGGVERTGESMRVTERVNKEGRESGQGVK